MPQLGAAGIAAIVSAAAGVAGTIGSTIAASKQSGRDQDMISAHFKKAREVNEQLGNGPNAYGGLGSMSTGPIGLGSQTLGTRTLSGTSAPSMGTSPFMKNKSMGMG